MARPINRSGGATASEQYLAKLADRAFLNLWSYPNTFIDKKSGPKGDGKELCDLLIVCGDDILIFSDKTISWPPGKDSDLAWQRWFKRAVLKSFEQIRGAERWIDQFPNRIYLDRQCTQPLPLKIPAKERRRVHGIVVALGAGQACKEYFEEGSGSLMIVPALTGSNHMDKHSPHYSPFAIGDLDPHGSFVHVLDDATLDIIISELDTVTDFTSYLRKKEAFIRSGRLIVAHGEHDMLAYYLTRMNQAGEHDFVKEDGGSWDGEEGIAFEGGIYEDFIGNIQYQAKKAADKDSYAWDALIELFTKHMLAGTTVVPDGANFNLIEHEEAVRHMALVPRYQRRNLAQGVLDALKKSQDHDRFVRGLLPGPKEKDRETGFFLLTLNATKFVRFGSYDEYRRVRQRMLYGYSLAFLKRNPDLKRIIGIAMEPPPKSSEPQGASEDLIMVEMPEWTQAQLDELTEYQTALDIMKEGRFSEYAISGKEYPDVAPETGMSLRKHSETQHTTGNRKQRRALAAEARKTDK